MYLPPPPACRSLMQNRETYLCTVDSVDGNRKPAGGSCGSPELVGTNAKTGLEDSRKKKKEHSRFPRGVEASREARTERRRESATRVARYGALKLFHFNNYEPELNTAWSDCEFARFAVLIAIGRFHK